MNRWSAAVIAIAVVALASCGGAAPAITNAPVTPTPTGNASVPSATPESQVTGSWSPGTQVGPPPSSFGGDAFKSISCPTSTFCVAVDVEGDAYTYSSGAWSGGTAVSPDQRALNDVSCASASFCTAVGDDGVAFTFSGGRWSAGSGKALSSGPMHDITCPSSTFCAAEGETGSDYATAKSDAYIYSGGRWSSGKTLSFFGDIACPTTSTCIALGPGASSPQGTYVYSGGAWSNGPTIPFPVQPNAGATSIACPTTTQCVSVGSSYASTFTNGTWSAPVAVDPVDSGGILYGLSCASVNFCEATDDLGFTFTYQEGSWSAGQQIETTSTVTTGDVNGGIRSVSCPTANFCIAVDGNGAAYTWSAS